MPPTRQSNAPESATYTGNEGRGSWGESFEERRRYGYPSPRKAASVGDHHHDDLERRVAVLEEVILRLARERLP